MVNKEIKSMYSTAAASLSDAKQALGDAIAQDLTFGGNHIAEFLEETKVVTNAIGYIMGLLVRNGERVDPIDGQDGFVSMMVNGRKLICSVEQLDGKFYNPSSPVLSATDSATGKSSFQEVNSEKASNSATNLVAETEKEKKSCLGETENNLFEREDDQATHTDNQNELTETKATDNSMDECAAEDEEMEQKTDKPVLSEDTDTIGKSTFDEKTMDVTKSEKATLEEKNGARFIVPKVNETNVSAISLGEIFQDEKSKRIDEFVFETYRIIVSHMGIGKGEDMSLMIAPLKISKYADANAPIVVYVYYKGRSYIRSSYDALDDGKNIVTMQIGDYELLFRGSFDSNGVFQSMISTTGISANQGDRMMVIDKKSHCPVGKQVKNGHIKFRYTAWENGNDTQGTMEVFPIAEDEDEYVAIAVHGEWRDAHYISCKSGGLPEVRLKTEHGIPAALICVRNGDLVEADIVMR